MVHVDSKAKAQAFFWSKLKEGCLLIQLMMLFRRGTPVSKRWGLFFVQILLLLLFFCQRFFYFFECPPELNLYFSCQVTMVQQVGYVLGDQGDLFPLFE
mgnify:CR=1 FL=1